MQNQQTDFFLKRFTNEETKQSAFGYHLVHEINRPKGIKDKYPDDVTINPTKRYSRSMTC